MNIASVQRSSLDASEKIKVNGKHSRQCSCSVGFGRPVGHSVGRQLSTHMNVILLWHVLPFFYDFDDYLRTAKIASCNDDVAWKRSGKWLSVCMCNSHDAKTVVCVLKAFLVHFEYRIHVIAISFGWLVVHEKTALTHKNAKSNEHIKKRIESCGCIELHLIGRISYSKMNNLLWKTVATRPECERDEGRLTAAWISEEVLHFDVPKNKMRRSPEMSQLRFRSFILQDDTPSSVRSTPDENHHNFHRLFPKSVFRRFVNIFCGNLHAEWIVQPTIEPSHVSSNLHLFQKAFCWKWTYRKKWAASGVKGSQWFGDIPFGLGELIEEVRCD